MIITMRADSTAEDNQRLTGHLRDLGFQTHLLDGSGPTVIGVNGRTASEELREHVATMPGVDLVNRNQKAYMLAQRAARPAGSLVTVGEVVIGGSEPVVMAGTCVVEDRETTLLCAERVQSAGAQILRGGAFKPRTSPYSFQGLGEEGLQILAEARELTGMPVVTEVMEPEQVDLVAHYADMLQIGSRNMSNFPLLRRAATSGKPILLKRGFSATVEEWMMSAEYVLAGGNDHVVLCERGIRGFDTATRFTLDLNAVPLAKQLTHLPVIVDPSHGTGIRELVTPMALAGVAAGAHGLIIEVHPSPDEALCDGQQSLTCEAFADLMAAARAVSAAIRPQRPALVTTGRMVAD